MLLYELSANFACSDVNESSNPTLGNGGVALTGDILGEKHVTGLKLSHSAVAYADLDAAGKGNAPLASRRVVPAVQIVAIHIVFED
jgi:hypothetical protein